MNVILAVVLYECEIWSPTLREEHRYRALENRVLRGIFGPKRDGVTGGWRKLHKEELRDLKPSSGIIRMIKSWRMRWTRHVAYMLLIGKPEGERRLERPRIKWVDNIKMGLVEKDQQKLELNFADK
jgi:hypothetical protein